MPEHDTEQLFQHTALRRVVLMQILWVRVFTGLNTRPCREHSYRNRDGGVETDVECQLNQLCSRQDIDCDNGNNGN